jgi:MSHA pilin protein MshD
MCSNFFTYRSSLITPHHQRGFSLVELVIGLVVMSIALVTLTTVLYPQFVRGLDPIFQIRAAELGQSLADEILGKAFDQLTPVGGQPPCNPCSAVMGSEAGENRTTFNDVDDYNDYCAAPVAVTNANNIVRADFANYQMQICVINDDNYSGVANGNNVAKLITITIFPPVGGQPQTAERIDFQVHRSNF